MEFQKLIGAGLLFSGGGGELAQAPITSEKISATGGICLFFILSAS
jgi:hypothetical protein